MKPALPEPPPAHGRASTSPPGGKSQKQRIIQNQFAAAAANPMNPYNPYGHPFGDPMVTWDPVERQRLECYVYFFR